jgi:tetratricopeptide (TPR) repeat protein
MKLHVHILGLVLVSALAAPALQAQISGWSTDGMGSSKDPTQKAVESYGRGVQYKRKAEAATDPEKKTKLYTKAKDELKKSVGYVPNYDAYLALGQVYLALGQGHEALTLCAQAQAMKTDSPEAKSCIDDSRTMDQKAHQKTEETPVPSSS